MSVDTPDAHDAITSVFPLRPVADIVDVQKREHRIQTNEYQVEGVLPIIDQSTAPIAGYLADTTRAYAGPLPVVVFGDHTCIYKFVDFRFAVGADGTQLLTGVPGIDTRYLYYALHTSTVKQFGYQRHFKLLKQSKIPVPLDIAVQRRIASILGTYDDLIEVNRRRIAVLEEMARRLFEEWFVHFRFPGNDALANREGQLPRGWSMAQLGDLMTLVYGKAMKATDRSPGRVPVIGSSGVVGFHDEALVQRPGIVLGRKGNVGAVIWSPVPFFPIDTVFYVESAYPASFLLHELRRMPFQSSDAAVPGLNRSAALKLPVAVPPANLVSQFDAKVAPSMRLIECLQESQQRLAASRDLLLPRLISGDLPITAAERELEAVA